MAAWLLKRCVVACGYTRLELIKMMCHYLYDTLPTNHTLVVKGGKKAEYKHSTLSPAMLLVTRLEDPFLVRLVVGCLAWPSSTYLTLLSSQMAQMFACKCWHERFTEPWVHWTRSTLASQSQMLLVWLMRCWQLEKNTHEHWWWDPFSEFVQSCMDTDNHLGMAHKLTADDAAALRNAVDRWPREAMIRIVRPELARMLGSMLVTSLGHDTLRPAVARLMLRHADPSFGQPADPPTTEEWVEFRIPNPQNRDDTISEGAITFRIAWIVQKADEEIRKGITNGTWRRSVWFTDEELVGLKDYVTTGRM